MQEKERLGGNKEVDREVDLELGRGLGYLGRGEEAVSGLQEGLTQTTHPRQSLLLTIALAETYLQMSRDEEADQLCKQAVVKWRNTAHTYEYLCLLYLYTISGRQRSNTWKLSRLLTKKYIRNSKINSVEIKYMYLYLSAELLSHINQYDIKHALIHYWRGLQLGKTYDPTSYLTLYARYRVGCMFTYIHRISQAESALSLCIDLSLSSILPVLCHFPLHSLYHGYLTSQTTMAYQCAVSAYPYRRYSKEYARGLGLIGGTYKCKGRWDMLEIVWVNDRKTPLFQGISSAVYRLREIYSP